MAANKNISNYQRISIEDAQKSMPNLIGFQLPDLDEENQYSKLKDAKFVETFYARAYYGDNNQYYGYSIITIDSKGRVYNQCRMRGIIRHRGKAIFLNETPQACIDYQNKVALVHQLMTLSNIIISDDRDDENRMDYIWLRSDLLTYYSVEEIQKMLSAVKLKQHQHEQN